MPIRRLFFVAATGAGLISTGASWADDASARPPSPPPPSSAKAGDGDVAAPSFKAGDTWTYKNTRSRGQNWQQAQEALTIVRAGPTMLEVNAKPAGSDRPGLTFLLGADWSRRRTLDGHDTLVSQPVSFPLTKGKSWTVDFTESHPDRAHEAQTFHTTYRVGDWEDVTVPAGTFHALKIEADGDWSAVITPATTTTNGARTDTQGTTTLTQTNRGERKTIGGRSYKAFWYVPAVKRWVKSEEDMFDVNGVEASKVTAELESDKVAP